MTEPRLSVVRRDLRGVAKALKDMKFSSLPDLVQVIDIIVRSLMFCVIEVESIQKEALDQGECLGTLILNGERLANHISDLEIHAGFTKAMVGDDEGL